MSERSAAFANNGQPTDDYLCADLTVRYEWVEEILQHKQEEFRWLNTIRIGEAISRSTGPPESSRFERHDFPKDLKQIAAQAGVSLRIWLRRP